MANEKKTYIVEVAGHRMTITQDGTIVRGKVPRHWYGKKIQDAPWDEKGGCEWKTIFGRPVLLKRNGVMCGGRIPKAWIGHRLQDKPWRTGKKLNKAELTEEKAILAEINQWQQEKEADAKRFRKLIMAAGGVKITSDYEYLPVWCRRVNGRPLDELVGEMKGAGYPIEDDKQLYDLLWQNATSDKGVLRK